MNKFVSLCCATSSAIFTLTACQAQAIPSTPPQPVVHSLADYPLLPAVSPAMQTIYQQGLANGNHSTLFSKMGDCMTASDHFFVPIGLGDYDLGDHVALQATIDYFSQMPTRTADGQYNAFTDPGLAAARGFNSASPFDPIWADPAFCRSGESPIACELRVNKPSFALVMFGTNDIQYVAVDKYEQYLRQIITTTLANNTIPIVSTFPEWTSEPEKSVTYNQVVVRLAQEFDIPLMNLYQALATLPNQGVNPTDSLQLTMPADGRVANFTGENLQAGYVVRNLVALQSLAIMREAFAQP